MLYIHPSRGAAVLLPPGRCSVRHGPVFVCASYFARTSPRSKLGLRSPCLGYDTTHPAWRSRDVSGQVWVRPGKTKRQNRRLLKNLNTGQPKHKLPSNHTQALQHSVMQGREPTGFRISKLTLASCWQGFRVKELISPCAVLVPPRSSYMQWAAAVSCLGRER